MIHELKTWPADFQAIVEGRKTHEVRKNDRGFMVGDTLRLREWTPDSPSLCNWRADPDHGSASGTFSGRFLDASVTHLTMDEYGLPAGLAIMSVRKVET